LTEILSLYATFRDAYESHWAPSYCLALPIILKPMGKLKWKRRRSPFCL